MSQNLFKMTVAIYVSTMLLLFDTVTVLCTPTRFLIVLVSLQQLLFSVSYKLQPLMSELWEQVFLSQIKEISGTTFVFQAFFCCQTD